MIYYSFIYIGCLSIVFKLFVAGLLLYQDYGRCYSRKFGSNKVVINQYVYLNPYPKFH